MISSSAHEQWRNCSTLFSYRAGGTFGTWGPTPPPPLFGNWFAHILTKGQIMHTRYLLRLVPTNIFDTPAPLSFIHGLLRWVFKPSLIKTKAKEGGWQLRSYLGLKFRGFRVQISKIPEYLTTGWVSNYFQRLCIAKDNQFFVSFFVLFQLHSLFKKLA